MNSKFIRQNLLLFIVGIAIEFSIAYSVAYAFGDGRDTWQSAALILGALYLFRLFNWFVKLIVRVPMYFATKNRSIDDMVALFYQYHLPVTSRMQFNIDSLETLTQLANDPDTENELRQFLYSTISEINVLKSMYRPIATMMTISILDASIARYRSEINARGSY